MIKYRNPNDSTFNGCRSKRESLFQVLSHMGLKKWKVSESCESSTPLVADLSNPSVIFILYSCCIVLTFLIYKWCLSFTVLLRWQPLRCPWVWCSYLCSCALWHTLPSTALVFFYPALFEFSTHADFVNNEFLQSEDIVVAQKQTQLQTVWWSCTLYTPVTVIRSIFVLSQSLFLVSLWKKSKLPFYFLHKSLNGVAPEQWDLLSA